MIGVKTFTRNLSELKNKINILSVTPINIDVVQNSSSDSRYAPTHPHTHAVLPSLILPSPFSPRQAGWT